jgi:hypothetical protein
VVIDPERGPIVMDESGARNEDELQRKLRDHPELLPVEEFGLGGSMMVVGRETVFASGRPDLLAVSDSGDLIIVEMKTGPQNSDFRRALAQLIDYGSDLWGTTLEEFEERLAVPYFTGDQCAKDAPARGSSTLMDAITRSFPSDVDPDELLRRLRADLRSGAFTYVLAAQSLTPAMERSMDYLNNTMSDARFYGVELVKFEERDGRLRAFEGRTVIAPRLERRSALASEQREELLARFGADHRPAVAEVLDAATSLGLTVYYGTVGASLKVQIPDRDAPVSIAWMYPPDRVGHKGTRDLTLAFDRSAATTYAKSLQRLEEYAESAGALDGEAPKSSDLEGIVIRCDTAPSQMSAIRQTLEVVTNELVAP